MTFTASAPGHSPMVAPGLAARGNPQGMALALRVVATEAVPTR